MRVLGVVLVMVAAVEAFAAETVTVQGVAVQVDAVKAGSGDERTGMLQAPADVLADGGMLPLKSGTRIRWWANTGNFVDGTLRENAELKVGDKTFTAKADTVVKLWAYPQPRLNPIDSLTVAGPMPLVCGGDTLTAIGSVKLTASKTIASFEARAQALTVAGYKVSLPDGATVGLGKDAVLYTLAAGKAPNVPIEIGGKTYSAGRIEIKDGKLKDIMFVNENGKVTIGGTPVAITYIKFDANGVLEGVLPRSTAKLTIDGKEQEVAKGTMVNASPDLASFSLTKAGLAPATTPVTAATMTPAPTSTPAVAATATPATTPVAAATPSAKAAPGPIKLPGKLTIPKKK